MTGRGVTALALWAREACVSRVIFESTSIYHRLLETGLAQYGISFARVNPRQARRFCEGAGQLAKTDRVDAGEDGRIVGAEGRSAQK
ncbi:IS110 family transposase [Falsihalocynthiibacter arcticus]|uniref:IS110 family transposase n=1 Tax=Falsihalocynthiibacter arcticus TaxID=1579316 RepID=UPI0030027FBB